MRSNIYLKKLPQIYRLTPVAGIIREGGESEIETEWQQASAWISALQLLYSYWKIN